MNRRMFLSGAIKLLALVPFVGKWNSNDVFIGVDKVKEEEARFLTLYTLDDYVKAVKASTNYPVFNHADCECELIWNVDK